MKNNIKNSYPSTFTASLFVLVALILCMPSAHAFGQYKIQSEDTSLESAAFGKSNFDFEPQSAPFTNSLRHDYAQNNKLKSRGAVMSEVKRRYDAKILKITLKQAREVYVVRLLMPNGKVKTVQVSARR